MNIAQIRSITQMVAPIIKRVGGFGGNSIERRLLVERINDLIASFNRTIEGVEGEYFELVNSLMPLFAEYDSTDESGNIIKIKPAVIETVESQLLLDTIKRLKGHVARLESAKYRLLSNR